MAVESPGFPLQSGTYGAAQTRRAIFASYARGATVGSALGGVVGKGDCEVTAGAGMSINVASGEVVIPGFNAAQSAYYNFVSSTSNLAIAASDPALPRVDRISAVVKDASFEGAENSFTLAVETGTPKAGATTANEGGIAAAPRSSLTLAKLLVPAASASVSGANIENVVALATPGLQGASYLEGTAGARPAAGVKGRIYYATDTKIVSYDTGAAWIESYNIATSNNYGAVVSFTKAEAEAGHTPSATRLVWALFENTGGLEIGGKGVELAPKAGTWIPVGQAWKATVATKVQLLFF